MSLKHEPSSEQTGRTCWGVYLENQGIYWEDARGSPIRTQVTTPCRVSFFSIHEVVPHSCIIQPLNLLYILFTRESRHLLGGRVRLAHAHAGHPPRYRTTINVCDIECKTKKMKLCTEQ